MAAPNIAYAVQNGGDGGSGGGGDDSGSGGDTSSSGDRDAGAAKLRDEHRGSKKQEILTEENSYTALEGGPDGTTAEVNPEINGKGTQGEKNPDVKLLDRQGNVVGYREVKTIENAKENGFKNQLKTAVRQLNAKGEEDQPGLLPGAQGIERVQVAAELAEPEGT